MEKILKKQTVADLHNLYGLTPLYYYLLPVNEKLLFNEIASKAINPIGFIEAVLEVASMYEDFYVLKKTDSLTEEQVEFLNQGSISQLMLNLMRDYSVPISDLKNIRSKFYFANEIYTDSKVGELNFKDLMSVSNTKYLQQHLNAQIKRNNPLTKDDIYDISPSAQALKVQTISNLESLLEDVVFSIEKIDGQISTLEGIDTIDVTTEELRLYFSNICDRVENTDKSLMSAFQKNETPQSNVVTQMVKALHKIGFDVTTNVAGQMYSEKTKINVTKREFNKTRLNSLNDKKRVFSNAKTSIVTAIQSIKKGEERNIFYF